VNTKEAALVPHSRSDADLARDVNAGDASAFEQVFDRHATTIYNYCFRRTASWDTAQDATSTVFLEAWRTRERLAVVDDSVLPWLYGIATNVCRNANRSATRYLRALTLMPVAGDVPDHADDVAGRLDAVEGEQAYAAAVRDGWWALQAVEDEAVDNEWVLWTEHTSADGESVTGTAEVCSLDEPEC
jgi:RNA polymerase sigma-70 factor (ECF subfamily)